MKKGIEAATKRERKEKNLQKLTTLHFLSGNNQVLLDTSVTDSCSSLNQHLEQKFGKVNTEGEGEILRNI